MEESEGCGGESGVVEKRVGLWRRVRVVEEGVGLYRRVRVVEKRMGLWRKEWVHGGGESGVEVRNFSACEFNNRQ